MDWLCFQAPEPSHAARCRSASRRRGPERGLPSGGLSGFHRGRGLFGISLGMRRVAWFGVLCVLALTGCGYSVVRYSGALGDIRSVAVVTPENDSAEPGAEFVVADALRREFLQRGAVRLVEDPAAADLVLAGHVLAVSAHGQSFASTSFALEFKISLRLTLDATRRDGGRVPIGARAMRESERYLSSADAEALRKNREEALRRAAQVLAGRVYDSLYATLTP